MPKMKREKADRDPAMPQAAVQSQAGQSRNFFDMQTFNLCAIKVRFNAPFSRINSKTMLQLTDIHFTCVCDARKW